jgi:hypothetical protein
VNEKTAQAVAERFVNAVLGPNTAGVCIPYEDINGSHGIFVCERVLAGGASVTVMVGAKTEMPPVLLYYHGQPLDVTSADQGMMIAHDELGLNDVRQIGSVYYSPLDFWFEYQAGTERVMVSPTNFRVYDPVFVRAADPISYPAELVVQFEEDWQGYSAGRVPFEVTDAHHWISGVPDWDWHYGCGPTAAANVLTYWDNGVYDLLVDSVMWLRDTFEHEFDSVPNTTRQLAVAMNTDTIATGGTRGDSIAPGIVAVCNDPAWSNNYAFTSYLSGDNHSLLISEINSGRPGVLLMANHPYYGNHAVTFCGWGEPDSNWIMIHDEWSSTPVDMVILYYYGAGPRYVIPVVPGGATVPDVAVTAIHQPADTVAPGWIQPVVQVSNFGSSSDSTDVFFRVERPGGGFYESFNDTVKANFPPPGWLRRNVDMQSAQWTVDTLNPNTPPGYAFCNAEPTLLGNDDWLISPRVKVNASDTITFWYKSLGTYLESLEVWVSYTDTAISSFNHAIQAFDFNNTTWQMGWADFGLVGDTAVYIGFRYKLGIARPGTGIGLDDIRLKTVLYSDSARVLVESGHSDPVSFQQWRARLGHYQARCSTYHNGDVNPTNDELTRDVVVVEPPPQPSNWTEMTPMPTAPSGKAVKRGGSLTWHDGDNLIFATKGYKTGDFYSYNPATNAWTQLAIVPFGPSGRPVGKGGRLAADGERYVYLVKGKNTVEFWRYDPDTTGWEQQADVPLGASGKRVKGGGAVAHVVVTDTGYVYLLKGYRMDFMRYNTVTGLWQTRASAPPGVRGKWYRGSFMVYDDGNLLYAHHAKYHAFYKYDIAADSWHSRQLTSMPYEGQHGSRIKRKKIKDGGCGVKYGDRIYALKGGNTQQFFAYSIAANNWEQLDTVPNYGSTGRKKRVKYGADMVAVGNVLYALKGNKTRELWRYTVAAFDGGFPTTPTACAGVGDRPAGVVAVFPSPTRGVLRVTGLRGLATLSLHDVVGREVLKQVAAGSHARLELGGLAAGVYLLRVSHEGKTVTARVVLARH